MWAGGKIVGVSVIEREMVWANKEGLTVNFPKMENYAVLPTSILELNRIQNLVFIFLCFS